MKSGALLPLVLFGIFAGGIIIAIIYTALSKAKGHLQIVLPKQLWQGGETLSGKVVLMPYKETRCRRISISLSHRVTNGSGKKRSTATVYSDEKELASLGQLVPNVRREYEFQFNLPEHSLDPSPVFVTGNQAMQNQTDMANASIMQHRNRTHQEWFLTAHVDADGIDLFERKTFHCAQKMNPHAAKIDASLHMQQAFGLAKWFMICFFAMMALMIIIPIVINLIPSMKR